MFATSLALIAQEFQGSERATAFGDLGRDVGGAVAVGPLVGGVITERFGWEWIFFVNVPIGIAAIVLTETQARQRRRPRPAADRLGRAWSPSRSALFLLIFGLIRGNAEGWGSPQILASLIGAAVLLAAFVAIECGSDNPMLDLSLFRKPAFGGVSVVAFGALGRDVRDVPLPDALHPGRPRLLAARGGPALPAADGALVHRRADRGQALEPGAGPGAARRRADPGRGRACC